MPNRTCSRFDFRHTKPRSKSSEYRSTDRSAHELGYRLLGSPLTKVSRWIFEKSTRSARTASFPLPPTLGLSRSLSYTHARRNDETGRRLRESVFLAYYPFLRFPTVRKKNTRLGCWLMYRRYRPAALAVSDSHARTALTCTTRFQDLQLITDFIARSHDQVAVAGLTRNLGSTR